MALQNSSIEPMNTFLGRTYYIPNYQREYSWEKEELEDFWEDLKSTVDDGNTHFFGQVVIHYDESKERNYIIDGQQRTITSTIFMRVLQLAFAKVYSDSNDSLEDADYKKADISSIHIGRAGTFHLVLGELDQHYFETCIQRGCPDKTQKCEKKSHERIRQAFLFLEKELNTLIEEYSDLEDRLEVLTRYYDAFTKKFMLLYMEATKLEEAFVIFETLNARGKDLETADLLKNYIFSQSREIELAQGKWGRMINALDKADPTKYIRHFWNSNNKFTREKALYRAINKSITSPRDSKELLTRLESCAQCYHDMVFPQDNVDFTDDELVKSLIALDTLKASTFYPIILAMKQQPSRYCEADIRTVLHELESYVFRNATICGNTANKAEVFLAETALNIYNESLADVSSICNTIKEQMVSDQEFKDSFKIWKGSKRGKETIRYILRKIHNHFDENMEISLDNSTVHIEHIMPEDASQWNVDEEIHDEYLWRLGNLALLSGRLNRQISNKIFDEKKDRYRNSQIQPNANLYEYTKWDVETIEDRQEKMAEYALEIWKK